MNSLERRIEGLAKMPQEIEMALRWFLRRLQAQGLSGHRQFWYLTQLVPIAEQMGACFLRPSMEDVERVVANIENSDLSEWTKQNKRVALKRFYKWLLGEDEEYPPVVRWIKTSVKNHKRKLPKELLTQEDVQGLVRFSLNPRDRALISVLWDSGARIGEEGRASPGS